MVRLKAIGSFLIVVLNLNHKDSKGTKGFLKDLSLGVPFGASGQALRCLRTGPSVPQGRLCAFVVHIFLFLNREGAKGAKRSSFPPPPDTAAAGSARGMTAGRGGCFAFSRAGSPRAGLPLALALG